MEELDDLDRGVLSALGYAVARGQLFEFALLKLLEVQRHDLTIPQDDRWPEIEKRLNRKTAGAAANDLKVSPVIAADLKETVARRNVVAHHAWRFYLTRRANRGDPAAADYVDWLREQAAVLGRAYNAVRAIDDAARQIAPTPLDVTTMEARWRSRVKAPVQPFELPDSQ